VSDVKNLLQRHGWSVRSRKSAVKGKTVGAVRRAIQEGRIEAANYLVWVEGHVLILGPDGQTAVDTDPRRVDRRAVLGVFKVTMK
jgi:hypothetical protein